MFKAKHFAGHAWYGEGALFRQLMDGDTAIYSYLRLIAAALSLQGNRVKSAQLPIFSSCYPRYRRASKQSQGFHAGHVVFTWNYS